MKVANAGVGILLIKDNKVLMGKRNDDPEKADSALHGEGLWTCPGGKLDFGEKISEMARKEVLEETGIKANKLKVISVTNEIVKDAHFVTIGFLCDNFENEPKIMEPEEITEWKWFSFNNLPANIYPPSEKLINNYLEGKIYKGD
jgi:8-oxo-dGTP diphosphatase